MPQANLSLKEIYQKLCPQCQAKLREMIKEKLTDQAIQDSLAGKEQNEVV